MVLLGYLYLVLELQNGGDILGDINNQSDLILKFNNITGDISTLQTSISNHLLDSNNPHSVTAAQVGLGNVNNTADLDKPVSTAQQTAIDNAVAGIPYKTLTKTEYEGLTTVDANTIYFISDIDNQKGE